MSYDHLAGTWVYRSFTNLSEILPEFDPDKGASNDDLTKWSRYLFGQGEMHLHPHYTGALGGRFVMAPELEMSLSGRIVDNGSETRVFWHGMGVEGQGSDGWIYEYEGTLVPDWPDGGAQVQAIVGSVIRSVYHDELAPNATRDRVARPGVVASFILVRKGFKEARETIPLPLPVLTTLADRHHRLHHHLWHMIRDKWAADLNDQQRRAIEGLGWKPPHPNQRPIRGTVSTREPDNGAGEDFLYMHRQMIMHVEDELKKNNLPPIEGWANIPQPARISVNSDGFSVPAAWTTNDVAGTKGLAFIKSDDFMLTRMSFLQRKFRDQAYLRTLTLDQLGAKLEWLIHNQCHIRWSSLAFDPASGAPLPNNRVETDIDDKWVAFKKPDGSIFYYDDLNDTFSSHVHPVFWRLHGWIDRRIDDWFAAHSTGAADDVVKADLDGVAWFRHDGKWVTVEKPWVAGEDHSIATMEKLVAIIRGEPATAVTRNSAFMRKMVA